MKANNALTPTIVREENGFRRTAIIVTTGTDSTGSIDVIARAPHGDRFIGRINVFVTNDGTWMVDVIDTSEQFSPARALVFGAPRQSIEGGSVVSAHFALKGGQ